MKEWRYLERKQIFLVLLFCCRGYRQSLLTHSTIWKQRQTTDDNYWKVFAFPTCEFYNWLKVLKLQRIKYGVNKTVEVQLKYVLIIFIYNANEFLLHLQFYKKTLSHKDMIPKAKYQLVEVPCSCITIHALKGLCFASIHLKKYCFAFMKLFFSGSVHVVSRAGFTTSHSSYTWIALISMKTSTSNNSVAAMW